MIDLPETTSRTQLIPTDEEAHRFLDILANEDDPYKTFYALAIYTGCRRGELCALKWEDIIMNGDESILTVSRSRSSVLGRGVVEGITKNGQARTIYLSEDMTNILRSYCYMKMCEARENGFEMSDYVFTNERGELMHPDSFSRHLRRLYDENGFPREFHLHTLRHYFVSTMLHNGVDKQTVAELAGHGDTGFLERTYCHPQLQLKRQAAERYTQTMFDFSGRDSESA
nr:site-specific integrase [uncultured Oscillibacter sp.]